MHAAFPEGRRADVLALVKNRPGLTPAEVASAFGVDHSTATYHLRRLARARLVAAVDGGRALRYYAAGCGICPFLRRTLPLLRDARYAETLAALGERGRRVPELARDPQAASRLRGRLERLEAAGYVENRRGTWRPTAATAVCRVRAAQGGTCDLWGRCPVSLRDGAS